MEFLTLVCFSFLFANHGTTFTWCLGCKFIMWQLVTAELSLSRLLFDSDTRDCASRYSAFRFEARRSVCSRYGPIRAYLARLLTGSLALIFNRTFADKLASFKISDVNQQLVD